MHIYIYIYIIALHSLSIREQFLLAYQGESKPRTLSPGQWAYQAE